MESTKETNFKKIRKKILNKNKEMFSELKKIIMYSEDEHILHNEEVEFIHIPLGIENYSFVFYESLAFIIFPASSIIDHFGDDEYKNTFLVNKNSKTSDITYGFFALFSEYLHFDDEGFFRTIDKELKFLSNYSKDIFFYEDFEIFEFYSSLYFYDMFKMLLSNLESIKSIIFNYVVSLHSSPKELKILMDKHPELFEKDIVLDKKNEVTFPLATKI